MGNNILVSEVSRVLENYFMTDQEIVIFVDDPNIFEKRVKYRFLIKILDAKTVDQQLNNIKLIYHQKIE